mgnify:CR=1 FL=1
MKSDLYIEAPLETVDHTTGQTAISPVSPVSEVEAPPPATWIRIVVSVALIAVILAIGAGVMQALVGSRPHATQTPTIRPPTLVESHIIDARDVREIFTGYGTARADKSVVVSAEVGGQLVEVPERIEDGVIVDKGDLLARVDDRTYRNQLERAESLLGDVDAKLARLDVENENIGRLMEIAERELEVNQAEYERLVDLRQRNSASKKEVDFARLAAEQSRRNLQTLKNQRDLIPSQRAELEATRKTRESEIELARLEVERCVIHAPMAGQVERISVEAGDHVMTGKEIARIVNTERIEVPVELPLSVRSKTRVGEAATLTMETAPNNAWHAKVIRLSPTADSESRTFIAYLEVANSEQATPLTPGAFLTAKVEGGVLNDALVIPRGALVEGHVFVADGHTAHRRKVHIETLIGDLAVVSGELKSGDRLITSNLDILHDGATIRVEANTTTAPNESMENDGGPGATEASR